MREGIRKVLFSHLVANIPYGTNKMTGYGKAYDVIAKMIAQDTEKACEYALNVFKNYNSKDLRYANIEALLADVSSFKSLEDIKEWYASFHTIGEIEEAVEWLEKEGYIRTWKKPARFGYRLYLGITPKGWKISHLYR